MTASEVRKIRNEILAKAEIAGLMLDEKEFYADPLKFGNECCWGFDAEKYTNDEEYAAGINTKLKEYNEKAAVYNNVLASIFRFLNK